MPWQTAAHRDVTAAVSALRPLIAEHADEAERSRRVATPVVDAMASAGVFHMLVPHKFGGGEVDIPTAVRTLEQISHADGSTGWVAMIGATTGTVAAYLAEDVSREIFRPGVVTGGVVAPRGRAMVTADGYRVTGRWPFGSGCQHSQWLGGGCFVEANGRLETLHGGEPDPRFVLFPAADVEIIDTWHVSGLRGTGSHDIAVNDLLVPREHSFSFVTDRPVQPGPLYGFSMMGLLAVCVAAVGLGIGRAAIDEVLGFAAQKTPVGRRKPLAEWNVAQVELAQAEAALRSGRAFLLDAAGDMWQTLETGDRPSTQQRALVRLAASQAVQGAVRAVDIAYNLGGGTSIYESSRLQRQFRDIHALTQHVMVGPSSVEAAGRALLGLDVPPGFL